MAWTDSGLILAPARLRADEAEKHFCCSPENNIQSEPECEKKKSSLELVQVGQDIVWRETDLSRNRCPFGNGTNKGDSISRVNTFLRAMWAQVSVTEFVSRHDTTSLRNKSTCIRAAASPSSNCGMVVGHARSKADTRATMRDSVRETSSETHLEICFRTDATRAENSRLVNLLPRKRERAFKDFRSAWSNLFTRPRLSAPTRARRQTGDLSTSRTLLSELEAYPKVSVLGDSRRPFIILNKYLQSLKPFADSRRLRKTSLKTGQSGEGGIIPGMGY
jgi:hypothetical protein